MSELKKDEINGEQNVAPVAAETSSEEVKKDIIPIDYWNRINKRGSDLYCVLKFIGHKADIYIENKKTSISLDENR